MNQEKIGKFIFKLRNEKNMTQQELANKIGVTDRAISNWENGRRMPDLSLLEPLTKELGITINELIKGEKIDNIIEDTDNNLKNSLKETKKVKNNNKILRLIILSFIVVIPFLILISGEVFHTANISFSSFKIMKYSNEFYKTLKSKDYDKIKKIITNDHLENQWHTTLTNYTTEDFINNLKMLEEDNIDYESFDLQSFYWNGLFNVKYKMCFMQDDNKACIDITINESSTEKGNYLFDAHPSYNTNDELQQRIIKVFNPLYNY